MVYILKCGFSLDPNKSTSYRFVSQWIFAVRHQSLSFISVGRAWVPGESWRTGGKSSGKNVPRNPLHSLLENLLNIWLVLTVSLAWSLAQRKEKNRRTPTGLGSSSWGSADSAFGTCWGVASPESLSCAPAARLFAGGSRKQEMRDCKGPSSHRSEDLLP